MKEGNVKENKQVEEAMKTLESSVFNAKLLGRNLRITLTSNVLEIVLNYIKELEEKINRLERDKRITIDKLSKLKNGLENDFPITLGKQQPLWEENQINYIPKQVIRDKIEKIKADEKEYDNKIRFYTIRDTLKFQEIVLKELLEEE